MKILGKDFKRVHELIQETIKITGDSKPFSDYINDFEVNEVIVDPETNEPVFFDELVYETNLESNLGGIVPHDVDESTSWARTFSKNIIAIHKILLDSKKNAKNLKVDKKAKHKFIVDWYKQRIDEAINSESEINWIDNEKEHYDSLVKKNVNFLPQFEFSEPEAEALNFITKYNQNPKDKEYEIKALNIQLQHEIKNSYYNPSANKIIDILIIASYNTSTPRICTQLNEQYNNLFNHAGEDRQDLIMTGVNEISKEIQFRIWKIWYLTKIQKPENEMILKIENWIKECDIKNNNYNVILNTYSKEQYQMINGAKILIKNILENEKKFAKQWIKDLKDQDSEFEKKILKSLKKEAK